MLPETRVPAGWGARSDPSGRWMAAVAHELKNPIQGLENALYLLQQTPLDKPARVYMDFAKKELEHMKLLVAGLLDRYRSKADPDHVSMSEVLDAALAFYAHKIEFKKVEVVTCFSTPGLIHAPAGDMRQVFRNLIVNALEALPAEGGRLVLRISRSRDWNQQEMDRVRVTIADNGSGIPPQDLGKIFSGSFTTKGSKGTGVGLWMARRIIEHHGGSIRVRSSARTQQSWTCFSALLPGAYDRRTQPTAPYPTAA